MALVAQTRYLPNAPGTWKPWQFIAYADHRRLNGARPADVKELEAQLLRLNAIIKKTDGFTNPIGFSVETVGELDLPPARSSPGAGEPALTARPLPASLNFGAFGVGETGSGPTAKRFDTGETAQILFFVNQLDQPLFSSIDNSVPEFEKLDGDVARLAKPQPDVFGIPRYGDTLVLKRSAAPIWAAVTFAEALELVARGIDRRLVDERDAVARLQKGYNDMTDPKKREERLAEYKKIAPLQKDPAYIEKMMKADATDGKAGRYAAAANRRRQGGRDEERAGACERRGAGRGAVSGRQGGARLLRQRRQSVALAFPPLAGPRLRPARAPELEAVQPGPAAIGAAVADHCALRRRCLGADRTFLHAGGCTANKRLIESIDKAALLAWLQ